MPSENNNEIPLADQFSVLGVEEPNDGTKMITTTEATYFGRNRNQLIRKTVPIAEDRETTNSSSILCDLQKCLDIEEFCFHVLFAPQKQSPIRTLRVDLKLNLLTNSEETKLLRTPELK
ncbi:hypothetical protein NPIL_529291 [Nephila pilipes]|uniref:Uncharacterized protein n=1 Tax=Nephila pilipes TaxID=299642 RepID=A0A8X6U7P8_NEPPI|nr:hypothetical protein NPIL_529291 [Nephila pilipes]